MLKQFSRASKSLLVLLGVAVAPVGNGCGDSGTLTQEETIMAFCTHFVICTLNGMSEEMCLSDYERAFESYEDEGCTEIGIDHLTCLTNTPCDVIFMGQRCRDTNDALFECALEGPME